MHDPGGNWANRPDKSLSTIFLPWFPQNTASVSKRLVAVKTLQREFPAIAWKLLLALLPNAHQITLGSHKPIWRKFVPEDYKPHVTNEEYWKQVSEYADLTINMAKNEVTKLSDLIDQLNDLPPLNSKKLLTYLSSEEIIKLPEADRLPLWTKLMNQVSQHRKFAGADWAMQAEKVNIIDEVAKKLEPISPEARYRRLFTEQDNDLFEEKGNWDELFKELEKRRKTAISEIFLAGGTDAIIEFARIVASPYRVGNAFGKVAESDINQIILPKLLETVEKPLAQFVAGFIWSRWHVSGWSWVDKLDKSQWSETQIGQLLVYLPFAKETWKRSTELLQGTESDYWDIANTYQTIGVGGLEYAIDKLLEHGRPNAAISCLARMIHNKEPVDLAQSVKALLAALNSSENINTMDHYNFEVVIKTLQSDPDIDPNDLFSVEWAYLPILDGHHGASPKFLEQQLANNPDFFCKVIRTVYRSKNEDHSTKELTEQEKAIATNAYRLLSEWHTPPGNQRDGFFNIDEFVKWVDEVKKSTMESGHLKVALITLGHVLIYAPTDPDGLWINHSVATVLNAKDADEIRQGFRIELYNSHGVHWVDQIGKQERELAENYRKKADDIEKQGYHRLAVTLRELADSYDREAEYIVSRESINE
jgi:hypothetical protein